MKETIYTIPVTEAFEEDRECPLCFLETKLENELVDQVLGASLMEPDIRKQTNDKGFCRKHFELIYNKQENKLGLGLIINTHMAEQNKIINNININNKNAAEKFIEYINGYESKCYICERLDYTMNRYMEVMFYLYFNDSGFKQKFHGGKGFCLYHLKDILKYTKKLDSKKAEVITGIIFQKQIDNMERIQEELDWFTKKFDYRYQDEPWENSKDAIPRGIKKLKGPCRIKS